MNTHGGFLQSAQATAIPFFYIFRIIKNVVEWLKTSTEFFF